MHYKHKYDSLSLYGTGHLSKENLFHVVCLYIYSSIYLFVYISSLLSFIICDNRSLIRYTDSLQEIRKMKGCYGLQE